MRPLALNTFAKLWGINCLTVCQNSDCSVGLDQSLFPAMFAHAILDYIGMWHAFQTLTVAMRSSKGIYLGGGGQGNIHRAYGLRNLMNPSGMFLEWEGVLEIGLLRGTTGSGKAGFMRQLFPRHMPVMVG